MNWYQLGTKRPFRTIGPAVASYLLLHTVSHQQGAVQGKHTPSRSSEPQFPECILSSSGEEDLAY